MGVREMSGSSGLVAAVLFAAGFGGGCGPAGDGSAEESAAASEAVGTGEAVQVTVYRAPT